MSSPSLLSQINASLSYRIRIRVLNNAEEKIKEQRGRELTSETKLFFFFFALMLCKFSCEMLSQRLGCCLNLDTSGI